jgi:hypothetical protein
MKRLREVLKILDAHVFGVSALILFTVTRVSLLGYTSIHYSFFPSA